MEMQLRLTRDEFNKALAKGLGVKKINWFYVPNFLENHRITLEIEK